MKIYVWNPTRHTAAWIKQDNSLGTSKFIFFKEDRFVIWSKCSWLYNKWQQYIIWSKDDPVHHYQASMR